MRDAGGFVITYGRVSDPARAVTAEGRGLSTTGKCLGRQVALLTSGSAALRLNSAGWLDASPEVVASLQEADGLQALCRARIMALAPHFAVPLKLYLHEYLDAAAASVPAPPTEAVRRKSITSPADRFFESYLPLPNAWIAAHSLDAVIDRPESTSFVRVDVAFWTGQELIAVMLRDESSIFGRTREAVVALSGLVRLVWWPPAIWFDKQMLTDILNSAQGELSEDHVSFGPVRNSQLQTLPQS